MIEIDTSYSDLFSDLRLPRKQRKRTRGSVQVCSICKNANATLHKRADGTYICEICKDVYEENDEN